jgi:UDP-3-O-[3-hydroxymyristoyl] glucosamine N-acyltransferase
LAWDPGRQGSGSSVSDFPLRRPRAAAASLGSLARLLDAELLNGGADRQVDGVAPLASAGGGELGFLADRRYLAALEGSGAAALLVAEELAEAVASDPRPRLILPDPHAALRALLEFFFPVVRREPTIHPTAVVADSARLGTGVHVGPYAVVEEEAEVAEEVTLGAHVVVGAGARIGRESLLHPHVVVYPGTVLGARVTLHSGVSVGVDGFGYSFEDGGHRKVPQVGGCVLEDDVEIGANTTVDRGSIGLTRVGTGTKLDNLVQLGHNVEVGRHTVFAAQVGVAGSTRIGDGVLAGGQVGIGGHLTVGSGARLAGQAGVTGDVASGATVMGMPARPRGEFLRGIAAQGRTPELLRRIRALERELEALRSDRSRHGSSDEKGSVEEGRGEAGKAGGGLGREGSGE